jgi:hypothetical protein
MFSFRTSVGVFWPALVVREIANHRTLRIVRAMSTLAEIETAVDSLPLAQQEALLHRLEMKVRARAAERGKLVIENGHAVLVAPPGAPAMTPELVKSLLADFP